MSHDTYWIRWRWGVGWPGLSTGICVNSHVIFCALKFDRLCLRVTHSLPVSTLLSIAMESGGIMQDGWEKAWVYILPACVGKVPFRGSPRAITLHLLPVLSVFVAPSVAHCSCQLLHHFNIFSKLFAHWWYFFSSKLFNLLTLPWRMQQLLFAVPKKTQTHTHTHTGVTSYCIRDMINQSLFLLSY